LVQIDTKGNVLIEKNLDVKGIVKAKEFCIDDICITKEDLERIIKNQDEEQESIIRN